MARLIRSLLSAMLAAFLGAAEADAQFTALHASVPLASGARIRVAISDTFARSAFAPREHRIVATLRGVSADTLYVEIRNTVGLVAVPRMAVRGVEVSLGPLSRRGSAVETGLVGAVFYTVAVAFANNDPESSGSDIARRMAGGITIGFALGAWIGARRSPERWREAQLP